MLHLLSVAPVLLESCINLSYTFFLRSIVESNVVIYAVWSEHDLRVLRQKSSKYNWESPSTGPSLGIACGLYACSSPVWEAIAVMTPLTVAFASSPTGASAVLEKVLGGLLAVGLFVSLVKTGVMASVLTEEASLFAPAVLPPSPSSFSRA